MKIEDHIFAGIEAFQRGEQEHALLHACIVIDSSSQKFYGIDKSEKSSYINFIRNYYWILEPMMGSGLNLDDTYFHNVPVYLNKEKTIENLDIAAFIYYIFRCTQAHGKEIPTQYKLSSREKDGSLYFHIANNRLHVPETLIWGLLSICVFCKANIDIKTDTKHYFNLGLNQFCIADWWGLEDHFRPIAVKHNPTRVTLQGLTFPPETTA
jgi:hypothetical protein